MERSSQSSVRVATARIELRLHLANLHASLAEARDLREQSRALRAEAQLARHTATRRRHGG